MDHPMIFMSFLSRYAKDKNGQVLNVDSRIMKIDMIHILRIEFMPINTMVRNPNSCASIYVKVYDHQCKLIS